MAVCIEFVISETTEGRGSGVCVILNGKFDESFREIGRLISRLVIFLTTTCVIADLVFQ